VISFDTNILFAALESGAANHHAAREFLDQRRDDESVVLCELTLLELYTLLRNPRICRKPLTAPHAVETIQTLRRHPTWRVVDYAPQITESIWTRAAQSPARLTIYDTRLALTLRHHNVTDFATRNVKDFQGFGFKKVWDPLI
jgi:toxin-antitoxin system PIN domain toxin